MSVRDEILALQWSQLKYDEAYHKDIVILPLAQRIAHMALHNAKYAGYFAHATVDDDLPRRRATLMDAFIIALATVNALNQDLGDELGGDLGDALSIGELGDRLAVALPRNGDDDVWILRQFASHTGVMPKACESLDHLEAIPFRDLLKGANLSLFKTILADASAYAIDLAQGHRIRLREVEQRSILDTRYQQGAGGEA